MKWDKNGLPRKPEVIGIGAQKAGTTWLSQALGQHPQIWAPPIKEVQFFGALYETEIASWRDWHFRRGRENVLRRYESRDEKVPGKLRKYLNNVMVDPGLTEEWYEQVFAPAPQGTRPMDITPEYSTLPDEGVDHIARCLPKAKFIYIIRHPVDRAISQLKMFLSRRKIKPASLDEWIEYADLPELMQRGDYKSYVPRWNARFDKTRILYLPFGMIATAPEAVMYQVETFLGLDPYDDYRKLTAKVFSAPKDISVPDEARARLRAKLDDQFTFLEETFGKEFTSVMR